MKNTTIGKGRKMSQVNSSNAKKARWQNRLILTFVVHAVLVGSMVERASANTVGWWGFEGIPGQTAGIGTVFSNRVDASWLPAEVYARYSGTASTDYQPAFDDSIFGPYGMGDSTTSVVSRSTLRFTNSYADAGRSQGCPVRVQDLGGALDLQTFSLEGWFKIEPSSNNPGWRALFSKGYGEKAGGGFAYTFALYIDDLSQYIKAFFTVRDGEGNVRHLESVTFEGRGQNQFRDGNWHYVSLVVNGTAHKAHLYVDFDSQGVPYWIGQVELGDALAYNSSEPLVIGGNNLSNWQFCGSVDEVRFSDTVVNTADGALKKRGIPDGTVIGHFPMEGDFKSTVWTNYWTDPVLSVAAGGEMPSLNDREKEMVYIDKEGIRIGTDVDRKCLVLKKGRIQWAASELLRASDDSLTVEFFISANAEDNANWAGIVRSEYTVDSTTCLPWNISYTTDSAGSDVACRTDTDSTYNQSTRYAKIPLDGKWHHLAMQVWRQADGRYTSFALYVDYELRVEAVDIPGWTVYPAGTSFGFGLAGIPFVGRVDEVRLTKGTIPVDDFLRLRRAPCGMRIYFR